VALTEPQIRRYSRHVLLPDVGGTGQARLLAATVIVDLDVREPDAPDAGAELAALVAAATYLAAAGIGTLVLAGADRIVRESDIRASIALDPSHVGRTFLDAVSTRLTALNPDVRITDTPANDAVLLQLGPGDSPLVRGGLAATRTIHAIATGAA
jgi:adenylyltransferase/sulfurtransferase